ncbi:MAG: hypothetical protein QOG01_3461, partial [Pseudonocardiales bacterium]|nr:hypothetical protein [Pseudonocardiales bacterium]
MKVSRTCGAVLSISALVAGGLVALAGPAAAATQVQTVAPAFSGSADPNVTFNTTAVCDECYP